MEPAEIWEGSILDLKCSLDAQTWFIVFNILNWTNI